MKCLINCFIFLNTVNRCVYGECERDSRSVSKSKKICFLYNLLKQIPKRGVTQDVHISNTSCKDNLTKLTTALRRMKNEIGCHWLLLGILLLTFFTEASGECIAGKDQPRQRMCSDGSCVDWLRGRCPGKCALLEIKCDDGTCVRQLSDCRRSCYTFQKTKPENSSAGIHCILPNVTCPDGLCIHISQKHCCDVKCQHYMTECSDGSCIDKDNSRCPDEPCPANKPFQCKGAMKCITKSQKCDGKFDCPGGHDESGCDSSQVHWAISTIALVISSVCALIVWLCARKGSNIPDEENASRATPQDPGSDDPPSYEVVMSSDQYTISLKDQGLPSYEDVSNITS